MQINSMLNLNIIKKLNSEGVNSSLYLVEDTQLGSKFILKQIKKKSFEEVDRYFDESKKVYNVRHPNVVPVKYASYDDDYIYITMPYFENGSLNNLLEHKYLTVREIIKYSLDFLSAIYYIHNKGILHCDIKPDNILISEEGRAVIADFGSSLYMDHEGNAKLKNVYYKHIAPEQCLSSTINKKIDIYQIGTTIYRMCNGNYEYSRQLKRYKDLNALKFACAKGKFPIRKKYLPHIPKELIYIVEKCLSVDKNDRYDDVLDIINDLSKINSNLDYKYKMISEGIYEWDLQRGKKITLTEAKDCWKVKYGHEEMIVENKAKAYRVIRNIFKQKNYR